MADIELSPTGSSPRIICAKVGDGAPIDLTGYSASIAWRATDGQPDGGAGSPLGGGGAGRVAQGAGNNATGYGAGGGGAACVNNGGAVAGGTGSQGCILIVEYA